MDDDELLKLLTGESTRPIFVCELSLEVAKAIGARTTNVLLSRETTHKQETKRSCGDIALYRRAPLVILHGHALIQPPRHAVFVYHERADKLRSFKAVVKATEVGHEAYLVSLHRVDPTSVRAAYKKTIPLAEWEKCRREVGPPKNPT